MTNLEVNNTIYNTDPIPIADDLFNHPFFAKVAAEVRQNELVWTYTGAVIAAVKKLDSPQTIELAELVDEFGEGRNLCECGSPPFSILYTRDMTEASTPEVTVTETGDIISVIGTIKAVKERLIDPSAGFYVYFDNDLKKSALDKLTEGFIENFNLCIALEGL